MLINMIFLFENQTYIYNFAYLFCKNCGREQFQVLLDHWN